MLRTVLVQQAITYNWVYRMPLGLRPREEILMSPVNGVNRKCLGSIIAVSIVAAKMVNAQADLGSAGSLAQSCGALPGVGASQTGSGPRLPQFPPGQYPVKLPQAPMLGARNDLPNPYRAGARWGQLPAGSKWGSTASATIAPDRPTWAVHRCGTTDSRAAPRHRT